MYLNKNNKRSAGFTIVELLIVIVVIAILAAITVVLYNGIQKRAVQSAVRSGITQTVKQLELDKVDRGSYAVQLADLAGGNSSSRSDVEYQYSVTSGVFCLTGTLRGVSYFVSSNASSQLNEGVCSDHNDPSAPITDPVVHTQTGNFDGRAPSPSGYPHAITVNYDLQPTDYVFILFNARYNTQLTLRDPAGTAMNTLYARSMGSSGYLRHAAYGTGGLTGNQTFNVTACWSLECDRSDVTAAYIVYVIRGLGASPAVKSYTTDTNYGVQPPAGSVVTLSSESLQPRKLAIFSDLFYGNTRPTDSDGSTPALTWITDSSQGSGVATSIKSRHAYTTTSTTASYRVTMPASGSRHHGAVLFTFE